MSQKISRKALTKFARSHAVIIGIDSYDHITSLLTPEEDAKALEKALIDHQGFAQDDVHTWINVTKAELEQKFLALKTEGTIGKKHSLIFYFAGHGLAGDLDGDSPAGYLLPKDTTLNNGELSTNQSLVKMEWVFEQIASLDCHHTLVILDCCFAGAFRRINLQRGTKPIGLSPMSELRFRRYLEKKAFQVLTSAGPAEKAADFISDRGERIIQDSQEGSSGKPNSPFAVALIKALSGTSATDIKPPGKLLGDGVITANELFLYLHDEVERITRKSLSFKPQNPDLFPLGEHDGGQFVFCDPRHPKSQPDWDEREYDNPYKGLSQYDVSDADFYFGRSTDIENLRKIINLDGLKKNKSGKELIPKIITITGASGSGKSSLVKAGLLPIFLLKGYEVFKLRPSDRPWSIKQWQNDQWVEVLQTKEKPPLFVLPFAAEELEIPEQAFYFDPAKKQVFYIDQYEEVFTSCSDVERAQLENNLVDLLNALSGDSMQMIMSMRSDFEWQLELSHFGSQFWSNDAGYYDFFRLYRVLGLGLDDLRAALVHPAILFAYEFEQDFQGDLADTVLDDLNYLPSALPLLSYTMQEMVKDTDVKERVFKRTSYSDTLGGVSGVLSKRMQQIYETIHLEDEKDKKKQANKVVISSRLSRQELLKNIYLRMVALSDGDYSRRRLYRGTELDELTFLEDGQLVESLLLHFREADLISTGAIWGIRYEELIHDALIKNWPQGQQWINELGKENLVFQRQLWEAVSENVILDGQKNETTFTEFQFEQLWDANPKLMSVIQQVSDASKILLEEDYHDLMQQVLPEIDDDIRAEFKQLWTKWFQEKAFPELNSIILTGHSTSLLRIFLKWGKHRLNLAESAFVLQSWEERIKDIIALKEQKDALIGSITRVTGFILEDAKDNIYRLEYDEAARRGEQALEAGVMKEELSRLLMELAYFYSESCGKYISEEYKPQEVFIDQDRKFIALNMLERLISLHGLWAELSKEFNNMKIENSVHFQDHVIAMLAQIDAEHLNFLHARYYPTLINVREGAVLDGYFAGKALASFSLAQTPLTVWQYYLFIKAEKHSIKRPAWGYEGDNPAIYVNSALYLNWLNLRKGKQPVYTYVKKIEKGKDKWTTELNEGADFLYRLPTELEWDYAARGGDQPHGFPYCGSEKPDEVSWYNSNSGDRTHPVMKKKPVSEHLALYDMGGNIYERCSGLRTWEEFLETTNGKNITEHEFGEGRINRGGDYRHSSTLCLVDSRTYRAWDGRTPVGLRVASSES